MVTLSKGIVVLEKQQYTLLGVLWYATDLDFISNTSDPIIHSLDHLTVFFLTCDYPLLSKVEIGRWQFRDWWTDALDEWNRGSGIL